MKKLGVLLLALLAVGCTLAPPAERVCSGEAAVRKDFRLAAEDVAAVFASLGWATQKADGGGSARNLTLLPGGNVTAGWSTGHTDAPSNATVQVFVRAQARGPRAALEAVQFGAYWKPAFDALEAKGDPGEWAGPEYVPGVDPGPQTALRVSCDGPPVR